MAVLPSRQAPLKAAHFEEKYAAESDPWNYAGSPYEHEKYDATLGALPAPRYARALELGCSVGVFTARLARCCGRVDALDCSPTALIEAQRRCEGLEGVKFDRCCLPDDFPAGQGAWDLVVMSEMGYYLTPPQLRRLRALVISALAVGGDLVLVHWLGTSEDHRMSGDAVHEAFASRVVELDHLCGVRRAEYRLDVFRRRGAVAA